jgi:hypothetical protein
MGAAKHQTRGQRLWVEQNVEVEVPVRGDLLAGERAETQRHGRNRSDEGRRPLRVDKPLNEIES